MIKIKSKKFIALILALLSLIFIYSSYFTVVKAETTTAYTDVLEDLQKDENFKIAKYPASSETRTMSVIQIAESSDRELFIYVYEPCYKTEKYNVDKIRLGDVEIGLDTTYKDYNLTLLNSNGVFFKYKVEDFTVRESNVRYYDVVSLLYKLDEPYKDFWGQTITRKSIEVKQKWEALTFEGKTTYRMEKLTTVTIMDKLVGFIRYEDGYLAYDKCTDSHFVAFNTGNKIDTLEEVQISFYKQFYRYRFDTSGNDGHKKNEFYGEPEKVDLTLYHDDYGTVDNEKWFLKDYKWKRIQTINNFLKEEDFSNIEFVEGYKEKLSNMQFILRFTETPYTYTSVNYEDPFNHQLEFYTNYEQTHVSQVTILRLKFKTAGKPYNLGVVDNYQTGPDEPSGTVDPEIDLGIDDIWEKIQKIISLVLILVIGGVIVAILSPFIPMIVKGIVLVFSWIIKGIWWVICLPFKLIGKLFKRKDKK